MEQIYFLSSFYLAITSFVFSVISDKKDLSDLFKSRFFAKPGYMMTLSFFGIWLFVLLLLLPMQPSSNVFGDAVPSLLCLLSVFFYTSLSYCIVKDEFNFCTGSVNRVLQHFVKRAASYKAVFAVFALMHIFLPHFYLI